MRSRLLPTLLAFLGAVGFAGSAAATDFPGIDYPTGADELVIALDGSVMIGGDGSVYRVPGLDEWSTWRQSSGASAAFGSAPRMAPPTPPPALTVAQITSAGMERLYDLADDLGLLDESITIGDDFPYPTDWTPHGVTIRVGDETLSHHAPLLGDDSGYDPDELHDVDEFAAALIHLDELLGEEIRPERPFIPDAWFVEQGYAMPDSAVPWTLPAEPVVGSCVSVPSQFNRDTVTGGYLTDGGDVVYLRPVMPWERCDK